MKMCDVMEILLQVKNIKILDHEFKSSPDNFNVYAYQDLDKYDKFIAVGVVSSKSLSIESIEEVETEEITEEIETTTEEVEPKLTTVGNNEGITVEVNNQVTTVETLSTQQQSKFDNVIEKMFNIYEQLREDDPFRRTLKTILDKLMNDDLYSKCSKVNSIEEFINCIVDNALVDKTNVVKNIVKTKLLNLIK